MKKSPVLTFAVALAAVAAFASGYALHGNPEPGQIAAISSPAPLPAQPESAFFNESKFPESFAAGKEPGYRETQARAAGEQPGGVQPGASTAQFQPASTGMTGGESFPGMQPGAQLQPDSTGASAGAEAPPVPIPAAFRPLPPEVAPVDSQLAASVQGLQENFVDAIGGPDQDPNTLAYRQRWIAAQKGIDEQYRLLVGNQAFLIEQSQVNNQQ